MSRHLQNCGPEPTFRLLSKKEPQTPQNHIHMCFALGLQQSRDNVLDETGRSAV